MAGPAIGRRPRWAPSPQAAAVNWSHPLAARLDTCVLLNSFPHVRDLVTGFAPDVFVPTAGGFEPTVYGQGYQFQNDTATSRFEWSLTAKPIVRHPLTAVYIGNVPFQSGAVYCSWGGSSTGRGWWFGQFNTPGNNLRYQLGGVASYDSSTGATPATFGMPMIAAVTVDADGGTARFYRDGFAYGTATVGTMSASAPSKGLILGAGHNGTSYLGNYIRGTTAVMIWNRVLSAAEIAALYDNPFQMLRG